MWLSRAVVEILLVPLAVVIVSGCSCIQGVAFVDVSSGTSVGYRCVCACQWWWWWWWWFVVMTVVEVTVVLVRVGVFVIVNGGGL